MQQQLISVAHSRPSTSHLLLDSMYPSPALCSGISLVASKHPCHQYKTCSPHWKFLFLFCSSTTSPFHPVKTINTSSHDWLLVKKLQPVGIKVHVICWWNLSLKSLLGNVRFSAIEQRVSAVNTYCNLDCEYYNEHHTNVPLQLMLAWGWGASEISQCLTKDKCSWQQSE